jgi:hypothetical protein
LQGNDQGDESVAPFEEGDPMTSNPEPAEVIYLDLDGDDVPDAVLTRRVVSHDVTGDGRADIIDTITTIESAIGIDGVPASTETHSEVAVEGEVLRSA